MSRRKNQCICFGFMILVFTMSMGTNLVVVADSTWTQNINQEVTTSISAKNNHETGTHEQRLNHSSDLDKKTENTTEAETPSDSEKSGTVQQDKSGVPNNRRRDAIIVALKKHQRKIETS